MTEGNISEVASNVVMRVSSQYKEEDQKCINTKMEKSKWVRNLNDLLSHIDTK